MKRLLTAALLVAATMTTLAQRQETTLSDNWQFSRDRQAWQTVQVPHDWAISGPFDKKWDMQTVAIVQNGETEATEKTGRSGALPWIGEGHYKRTFSVPSGFKGHAELLFDGAMAEPTVSVNGRRAGYWAYGYNSFRVDVTPFIKEGENELSVDLQNLEESSRWYPGAGLYRPVTLILTPSKTYIDDWSLFVRPADEKKVKEGERVAMKANFNIVNPTERISYEVKVTDADGNQLFPEEKNTLEFANGKIGFMFPVKDARLWSPESPTLYNMTISLYDGQQKIDEKTAALRHPHHQRVEERRLPAERRIAQAEGRLPAPRPGPAGRCREQGRPHPPGEDSEGDGLRRHTHGPQHAEPDADGRVRLLRHDGHGRIV